MATVTHIARFQVFCLPEPREIKFIEADRGEVIWTAEVLTDAQYEILCGVLANIASRLKEPNEFGLSQELLRQAVESTWFAYCKESPVSFYPVPVAVNPPGEQIVILCNRFDSPSAPTLLHMLVHSLDAYGQLPNKITTLDEPPELRDRHEKEHYLWCTEMLGHERTWKGRTVGV